MGGRLDQVPEFHDKPHPMICTINPAAAWGEKRSAGPTLAASGYAISEESGNRCTDEFKNMPPRYPPAPEAAHHPAGVTTGGQAVVVKTQTLGVTYLEGLFFTAQTNRD
jgi:hypothetical protein